MFASFPDPMGMALRAVYKITKGGGGGEVGVPIHNVWCVQGLVEFIDTLQLLCTSK